MVLSMTGYGRAQQVLGGREITVELRSVNARYFEYSSRLPRTCAFLEDPLKRLTAEKVHRGKVELALTIQNVTASDAVVQADYALAESYRRALAALAANVLGANLIIQIIIFLAVSVVLLIFTRPWAEKHLNRKRVRTNYEREIGKVIRITEKVDNLDQTGKSVVDGQEWTVRSRNDSDIFEAGALARVVAVSGVKLIVEKCEEETV